MSEHQRLSWLPFLKTAVPADLDAPAGVAAFELENGCAALGLPVPSLVRDPAMGEGYAVRETDRGTIITGGDTGLLYGAYAFLMAMAAGDSCRTSFFGTGLRRMNAIFRTG